MIKSYNITTISLGIVYFLMNMQVSYGLCIVDRPLCICFETQERGERGKTPYCVFILLLVCRTYFYVVVFSDNPHCKSHDIQWVINTKLLVVA
jgi:hypothetical protein